MEAAAAGVDAGGGGAVKTGALAATATGGSEAGFVAVSAKLGVGCWGVAGFGVGVCAVEVPFDPSFFFSNPRATRKVPLDCSTLIGFVKTRLAPRRNAFATPLCPSTTATDSDC